MRDDIRKGIGLAMAGLWIAVASVHCSDGETSGGAPPANGPNGGANAGGQDSPGGQAGAGAQGGQTTTEQGGAGGSDGGAGGLEIPLTTISFVEATAGHLGPERGYMDWIGESLVGSGSFDHIRTNGSTVAYAGGLLEDYATSDIASSQLTAIGAGLDKVRTAGIKVVLRFHYGSNWEDPTKAQILSHITQLTPVLAAHSDVIAVVQAGFIGPYGEWHGSTLLDNPADWQEILAALLAAVPAERMVQVRKPTFKDDAYGGPLTLAQAFSGQPAARVGHHNDCFLGSDTDYNTYPAGEEAFWKSYIGTESRWLPMGGETCKANPPRSECTTALQELEQLKFSFLNKLHHPDVISSWQTGGCFEQIGKRLGQRFVLSSGSHNEQVRPGGVLYLELSLENKGYAALFNARPLVVVLERDTTRYEAQVDSIDVRTWEPAQPVTITISLRIPATAAEGSWRLALWLPDAATSIRDDPRYAVRFANDGTWQQSTGVNVLTTALPVSNQAPGDYDPTADTFEVLSATTTP